MLGGKGTKAWSSQTSGSLVVSCNKVPLIHPAKGKEHDGSLVWRHLHFIRKGTRERGRGGGGGGVVGVGRGGRCCTPRRSYSLSQMSDVKSSSNLLEFRGKALLSDL